MLGDNERKSDDWAQFVPGVAGTTEEKTDEVVLLQDHMGLKERLKGKGPGFSLQPAGSFDKRGFVTVSVFLLVDDILVIRCVPIG